MLTRSYNFLATCPIKSLTSTQTAVWNLPLSFSSTTLVPKCYPSFHPVFPNVTLLHPRSHSPPGMLPSFPLSLPPSISPISPSFPSFLPYSLHLTYLSLLPSISLSFLPLSVVLRGGMMPKAPCRVRGGGDLFHLSTDLSPLKQSTRFNAVSSWRTAEC